MRRDDRGDFEIDVPSDASVRDYRPRLAEVIETLAAFERRSPESVAVDLALAARDVVRFAIDGDVAADGTIPLAEGVALVDRAREALLAAASSAIEPRPSWGARRPAAAEAFIRASRLGQSERGSYVVTLLSPSVIETSAIAPEGHGASFARRATTTFVEAVAAAKEAAFAMAHGNTEAFFEAVEAGVSSNLCLALAGTFTDPDVDHLQVRVSWSPRLNSPGKETTLDLSADEAERLRLGGEALRKRAVLNARVVGPVVRLVRSRPHAVGSAIVLSEIEGSMKNVWVDLAGGDYDLAIRAHQRGAMVAVGGDLVKDGSRWRISTVKFIEELGLGV